MITRAYNITKRGSDSVASLWKCTHLPITKRKKKRKKNLSMIEALDLVTNFQEVQETCKTHAYTVHKVSKIQAAGNPRGPIKWGFQQVSNQRWEAGRGDLGKNTEEAGQREERGLCRWNLICTPPLGRLLCTKDRGGAESTLDSESNFRPAGERGDYRAHSTKPPNTVTTRERGSCWRPEVPVLAARPGQEWWARGAIL